MGLPSQEIGVLASVKSDRLWDHGEVGCSACSALQGVVAGVGEGEGAGASRRLVS